MEKFFTWLIFKIQYLFPGCLIRTVAKKNKFDLGIDFYVIAKTILAFLIINLGWYQHCFLFGYSLFYLLAIYFIAETIHYNILHILFFDRFPKPTSFRRNIILGFINYLEIVFNFSTIYAFNKAIRYAIDSFSGSPLQPVDYIYFSSVTGGTIGYGDIVPVGSTGHLIVIFQIFTFLIFISIFLSYNLSVFVTKANEKV